MKKNIEKAIYNDNTNYPHSTINCKTSNEFDLICKKKQTIIQKIKQTLKSSKAFSLIEILVVLFILAFVFAFVAKTFSGKGQKVTGTFDKLIRLNRRLVMVSKFYNNIYRLVIQLDSEGPERYWVERKQEGQIQTSSSYLSDEQIEEQEEEDSEEKPKQEFVLDDSFYSEPEVIPSFLSITKVESSVWEEDKTEGLVYIYYYPKGLAQETAVQFLRPGNQGRWTLYLDPVTKNFQILKKEKNLAEKGKH